MKKVLFILAGLLIIASGIMSVAAYEGHAVDVRAHVENSLWVENYEVDLGTCFPQEIVETDLWIGLSESFLEQERYSQVLYELWWEPKPIPANEIGTIIDPDQDNIFEAIYPYIKLTVDGDKLDPIGAVRIAQVGAGAVAIGLGDLSMPVDTIDNIHLSFNPPVFEGFVNEITDPVDPSGTLDTDKYILDEETFLVPGIGGDRKITVGVPMADLGNILKVQVTDIVTHVD